MFKFELFRKLAIVALLFLTAIADAQNVKREKDGFEWIPFSEYGRVGAQSKEGKVLVPAKFKDCYYENGRFSVNDYMGHSGVFDVNGKVIVPVGVYFRVYGIKGCANSPYVVIGTDGYGVLGYDGRTIIPAKYVSINPYNSSKGLFYVVKENDSFSGVADKDGRWLIKPKQYNELLMCELKGKVYFPYVVYGDNRCSGVCNELGQELNRTQYSFVVPQLNSKQELCYKIQNGYNYGLMDTTGKVLKEPDLVSYYPQVLNGKKVNVWTKGNLWGLADENKGVLVPCEYDVAEVRDGYVRVKKGCYMGLFDEQGTCIISPDEKYTVISKVNAREPFISVLSVSGKYGLYDLNGKKMSDAIYRHCSYHVFSNNDTVLLVKNDDLWGVRSAKKECIIPFRYDDLNFLETPIGNFYYVFKDNLVGLCDSEGQEIIDTQYSGIAFKRAKGKDYFLAQNGAFVGAFNTDGTQLINGETFESIVYDEANSQFVAKVGKRTCHFSKDGVLIADTELDVEQDKYISIADDCFERGKYKNAAKNYTLAINIKANASLYFNRAVSYYNAGKYNDAISDFRLCLKNNPSERLRVRSLELMDKAEVYQSRKEERINNVFSAIFGLALTGANIYFQSQAVKQRSKYSSPQSYGASAYNEADDVDDASGYSASKSSSNSSCPSLKVNHGKWYCANTGRCGMCNGDGKMDAGFGNGVNNMNCTLCNGTGECKYCQ